MTTFFNFILVAKLVLVLALASVHAGILPSLGIKRRNSGEENQEDNKDNRGHRGRRKLLPKVVPHPDSCYLMEFHSDSTGNDASNQMEPVLQRLEDDLDTEIRRINVFRRREFMTLLESIGFNECGNMPFYYNRRTGQAICGPTTYMNLRRWGTGDLNHLFQDPPENQHNQEEDLESSRRDVGFSGYFMEQMKALETRGKARAAKETAKRTAQGQGLGVGSSEKKAKSGGGEEESSEPKQIAPSAAAERRALRQLARQQQKEAAASTGSNSSQKKKK